ncbi:MAG: biotin/lipoyl-containing protein [Anaerolineales bacterium]
MIFHYKYQGKVHRIELLPKNGGYMAIADGKNIDIEPGGATVARQGRAVWVHWEGRSFAIEKTAALGEREQGGHSERILRAPMPGQVRQVLVSEGQQVEAGQVLVLLEAMKMEIRIQAPQAGKVARVAVSQGSSVDKEQTLVELEA